MVFTKKKNYYLAQNNRFIALLLFFQIPTPRIVKRKRLIQEMTTIEHELGTYPIKYNNKNKPFIQSNDNNKYRISFSYTKDSGIMLLCYHIDMAIDIEPSNRHIHNKLRDRIIHHSEIESLSHVSTIHLWTMKEAVAKLQGQGVSLGLKSIRIISISSTSYLAFLLYNKLYYPYSYLYTYFIDRYIISIAEKKIS